MIKRRVIVFVVVITTLFSAQAHAAIDSRLTQQLNPVGCTYTNVSTNLLQTSVATVCANGSAPTLDSVNVTDAMVILTGQINVPNPVLIRYWVNGHWYTYGVYQGLSVANGAATLILPVGTAQLQPGYYAVIIEVEAADSLGLVYRSIYPDAIFIPSRQVVATVVNTGIGSTTTRYIQTGSVGYIADDGAPSAGAILGGGDIAAKPAPVLGTKQEDDYVVYDTAPPVAVIAAASGVGYLFMRRLWLENDEL